jgi:S-methyl-5-thioribose-1-phosphate isomerase
MKVKTKEGYKQYKTIWMEDYRQGIVGMINQKLLPHKFEIFFSKSHYETVEAIKDMTVRGAGAIGAAAGYAMCQAAIESQAQESGLENAVEYLLEAEKRIKSARPTAQNLFYAVDRVCSAMLKTDELSWAVEKAKKEADKIAYEDETACQKIGDIGKWFIKDNGRVLTHCNAGWLAFVDHGTALSPVYAAIRQKKNVFVYADETRPRLQGMRLTAWELFNEGVPHNIIPDNAAGALMRQGLVDVVFVGADRIAMNGDVANKIGTYSKAVLAKENNVPFYVCAPSSTIDPECDSGKNIPIENRSENEVLFMDGLTSRGRHTTIRIAPKGCSALNPAFDVTPAKYITGIITENGVFRAFEDDLKLAVELAIRYRS